MENSKLEKTVRREIRRIENVKKNFENLSAKRKILIENSIKSKDRKTFLEKENENLKNQIERLNREMNEQEISEKRENFDRLEQNREILLEQNSTLLEEKNRLEKQQNQIQRTNDQNRRRITEVFQRFAELRRTSRQNQEKIRKIGLNKNSYSHSSVFCLSFLSETNVFDPLRQFSFAKQILMSFRQRSLKLYSIQLDIF